MGMTSLSVRAHISPERFNIFDTSLNYQSHYCFQEKSFHLSFQCEVPNFSSWNVINCTDFHKWTDNFMRNVNLCHWEPVLSEVPRQFFYVRRFLYYIFKSSIFILFWILHRGLWVKSKLMCASLSEVFQNVNVSIKLWLIFYPSVVDDEMMMLVAAGIYS
jgi:hypothetical protein